MRKVALLLAAVLALSALVYLPSLRGDFIWDDRPLILDDEQVHNLANASRLFFRDFFAPGSDDFEYGYYRPLVSLSYMVDWALWGNNPLGYRMTNLFWHLLATALLFLLIVRLLPGQRYIAALGAVLFGVHPVHAESVAWIAGRTDVICAVFAMAALLLWYEMLRRNADRINYVPTKKSKRPGRAGLPLALAAAAALLLSLLAKEMGAVVLLIAPVMAWQVAERKVKRLTTLSGEFALLLVAFVVYALLRNVVAGVGLGDPSAEHTLWKAIATFPGAFAGYVAKLIVPLRLTPYIVWPYVMHPFTLAGLAGLVLLAGLVALFWRGRASMPVVVLAAAGFVFCFAPLANLVRISGPSDMGFVMAERFLYLPSAFLALLIVAVAVRLRSAYPNFPRVATIVLVASVVLLLGARTINASRVWLDEERVYLRALSINENAPLMWTNLGAHLRRQGRLDEAMQALRKAEQINQQLQSAEWVAIYNNLGTTLASQGKLDEALAYFDKALASGGQEDRVQFNRGEALRLLGHGKEAIEAYDAALAVNPDYLEPRLRRAQMHMFMHDPKAAEADLREVLKRDPNHPDALANLGMIKRRTGDLDGAVRYLSQSLSVRPDNVLARMALGGVEGQRGDFAAAAAQFQHAMELAPNDPRPASAMAAALYRMGEKQRAKQILDRAAEQFPGSADVLVHLLHWYYEEGDLDGARNVLTQAVAVAPDNPEIIQYQRLLEQTP